MTQKITVYLGIAVMAAVLFGGLAFSQSAAGGGGQGCTPGYWKANAEFKKDPANAWTTEDPDETLDVAGFVPQSIDPSTTLLETLKLDGGEGDGMERNLLRHCVAAKLNDENPNVVGFPLSAGAIISACNVAMATEDRDTMEGLKDQLEGFNDAFCPIDMKGVPING